MIEVFDYVTDNAKAIGGALVAIIEVFTHLQKLGKMIEKFLGLDDTDDDTDDDTRKG